MADARIMIVEDEIVVAMEIQRKLEAMGYLVAGIVASGEEAIEKASQEHPDLVLMDIRLADRVDGIEAANRIREKFNIPVVYLTAHADEKTLQRAKLSEPFGYLVKPFSEVELRSTIEVSLYKHGQELKTRKVAQAFSTTLSVLGGAVIVIDNDGMIEHMNSVAQTLTGWNKENAIGRHLTEIYVLKDEETGSIVENPIPASLKPGFVSASSRYLLVAGDKDEIHIESRVIPVTDPRGEIAGAVFAFQDISQDVWANQDWFSYAANLCLSADMARSQGNYAEAESLYQRALLLLVKNLGSDHPRVAHVLKELSVVFERMGKIDPARTLRLTAATILAKE